MHTAPYVPKNPVRFVTAASLFDGHDASINLIRRMLQATGVEVIHLGHNRSVQEVVETALEEDVQGIAISSYQGGHVEYFKYLRDLLDEKGAAHVKIFGGGGGVIVPAEISELEAYGITKIFSPEDGMKLGLQGMINAMVEACDFATTDVGNVETWKAERGMGRETDGAKDAATIVSKTSVIAHQITKVENAQREAVTVDSAGSAIPESTGDGAPFGTSEIRNRTSEVPVVGISGTGGAGKSTLTDELVRRFLTDFDDLTLAVLSVDPTRQKTGGALLGDRIRMNALYGSFAPRVFMRSLATRQANRATSRALRDAIRVCQQAGFDLVLVESAGMGQGDTDLADLVDVSLYVMTQEFGAPSQLEKIGMLDRTDLVALNKFEKRGSEDALRAVKKQMQRNRAAFDAPPDAMPAYPTMASHFNDPGVTRLYAALLDKLRDRTAFARTTNLDIPAAANAVPQGMIDPRRQRYLSDIADTCRDYRAWAEKQVETARKWGQAAGALEQLGTLDAATAETLREGLENLRDQRWNALDPRARQILDEWDDVRASYQQETYTYQVRGRDFHVPLYRTTLSGTKVPRVALPRTEDPGEKLRFALLENLPGAFPFTGGVFPFKREGEDPTRMFAGEGTPERTNRRFHLVSEGQPAARLSTAFDSVTLYGFDPDERPDIYGKVGNAGVSICTLDDMKKLYSGFDLCAPTTSVSMTINGPAPMLLAMFLNTAVDQQVEKYFKAEGRWDEVEQALDAHLGGNRPTYAPWGPNGLMDGLPPTHDGSGLGLLGATGADLVEWGVLDADTYQTITDTTLSVVRGTVQADILKEDQAQNTCIFSTDFALRLMGDIQQSFVDRGVRNYYSVSISGYHIAEAGANPISQLAFTLSNGFTYVEYYLSRGMDIDSLRAEPVVLLLERHGRRVYRARARGAAHLERGHARPLRRERQEPEAQVPHPDERAKSPRPGDPVQRHPHDAPGLAGRLRQLQQPPHERLRRGHHDADRRERATGDGDPAHHQPRTRAGAERKPAPGRVHRGRADGSGRGSRAPGVRKAQRPRRRAWRDGDDVPARAHPGRVDAVRAAQAQRRVAHRGRQHVSRARHRRR